ncbi:TRAP transporter small permease [Xanthomonas axonopodis]|uniref:TRAP transporter small permease n=1 Tax=Xanthomonas axonopodis TaxID=53413 RepID=UPI003557AFB0
MSAFPVFFLKVISDYAQMAARTFACLLLCLVLVAATTQVIGRNALGYSPHWLEELMRYSFIWITSLGTAMLVKTNGHAVIDILVMKFRGKTRQFHQTFVYVAIFVCALVLMTQGLKIMMVVHQQLSPSMRLPMSYVYAALPVGGILMGIHSLLGIFQMLMPCDQKSLGAN